MIRKKLPGLGRTRFLDSVVLRLALAAVLIPTLAGCGLMKGSPPGTAPEKKELTLAETKYQREMAQVNQSSDDAASTNSSFAGALVADEPVAAWAARAVLQDGGNAADAATALYFALSVTYPSAAGLGGGGVCLARASAGKPIDSISFPLRAPAGGGAIAIPGNVRGFAYIHAHYGSKPWASVVSPGERLAAKGFEISRASARQFSNPLSPELARLFVSADGRPLGQGVSVSQVQLSNTLSQIRSRGVLAFYAGETGSVLVQQSRAAGGNLSAGELSAAFPDTGAAQNIADDGMAISLPAASTPSGAFAAALWQQVTNANSAEALSAAADSAAGVAVSQTDFGSTAFAAVDGRGGAVACAVTMNGAFGTGRAASGTGVIFATSPQAQGKGQGANYLVPLIVTKDSKGGELYGAGAGAGPKGSAAIEGAARQLLADTDNAKTVLAQTPADAASPANAIVCPSGLGSGACALVTTPGGNGVGYSAAVRNSSGGRGFLGL